MLAPINKIIDLSIVDGKGCRTSIFLQGCNIFCKYCHNPETRKMCNHCGDCVKVCPSKSLSIENNKVVWDDKICINCDLCIKVCKHDASPKIKYLKVDEVVERIKSNIPFIRGITISGGECSIYHQFLIELFKEVKKLKLSCFIDTNGCVSFEDKNELVELTDGFLLDIKAWDNSEFKVLTDFENAIMKENLLLLNQKNKIEELRIVCVNDIIDIKGTIDGIYNYLNKNVNHLTLKMIPFSKIGVKGELKDYRSPTKQEMNHWIDYASSLGFKVITTSLYD